MLGCKAILCQNGYWETDKMESKKMKKNTPEKPIVNFHSETPISEKTKLAHYVHQLDAFLIDRWGIGWSETWATDIVLLKVWEQRGLTWSSLALGTIEQANIHAEAYSRAVKALDDNAHQTGHVSKEGTEFVNAVLQTFPGAQVVGVRDAQAPLPDNGDDLPWDLSDVPLPGKQTELTW